MGTGAYWDKTWNLVIGCDRVSAGCDFCFAIPTGRIRAANPNPAVAAAFAGTVTSIGTDLDWTGQVNQIEARLGQPYAWRKPNRIYLTLLGDMFHAQVDDDFLARTFAVIATTIRHTYLCTTKRHARMRWLLNNPAFEHLVRGYIPEYAGRKGAQAWDGQWPLSNLHLAVSVEDQTTADRRIPTLLDTPAAVRWISAEPLLGPIDLTALAAGINALAGERRLDWVVTGGESGPGSRPVHPDCFRGLRDQCTAAGVPFLFKQNGDFAAADVFDAPGFAGGRAFHSPAGGTQSVSIRERGPSGTFRAGETRAMVPGDRTKGGVVMLDEDTVAVRMGVAKAGRVLDGRTWDELPAPIPARRP